MCLRFLESKGFGNCLVFSGFLNPFSIYDNFWDKGSSNPETSKWSRLLIFYLQGGIGFIAYLVVD